MNTIKIGITEFIPGPGYSDKGLLKKAEHRAVDGTLYYYKYFQKNKWSVPLDAISKSDADALNSLWSSLSAFAFYPDIVNFPAVSFQARMINSEKPLQEFRTSYWMDKFFGTLEIEEV
jgi:hypothetical protein